MRGDFVPAAPPCALARGAPQSPLRSRGSLAAARSRRHVRGSIMHSSIRYVNHTTRSLADRLGSDRGGSSYDLRRTTSELISASCSGVRGSGAFTGSSKFSRGTESLARVRRRGNGSTGSPMPNHASSRRTATNRRVTGCAAFGGRRHRRRSSDGSHVDRCAKRSDAHTGQLLSTCRFSQSRQRRATRSCMMWRGDPRGEPPSQSATDDLA